MNLISHRGNNDHNYRENSKEALLNVLNVYYIEGIEFDIRITKDKEIIINHNKNILEKDPLVCDLTLKEIKDYSIKGVDIATLEEFLKEVNSEKKLIIEIKEERDNFEICALLDNILKKYPLNYYICSFNYALILYMKNNYNYKCGLLIGKEANLGREYKEFDFLSIYYKHIKRYKNANQLLCTWTVNNNKDLKNIPKDCLIITNTAYLFK